VPKVSVIVPSYNHARFLAQRLQSILKQTFSDFEVIVIDDASTDNSREVFETFTDDSRVRGIFNTVNNGCVFTQWNTGFHAATGDYIWIAESDDYADDTFLEVLVQKLDAFPSAGIAYCQSWMVDEEGNKKLHVERDWWGPQFETTRWQEDFLNNGRDELAHWFSQRCIIANASSALLRRSTVEAAGYANEGFLLAGDWYFWAKMLMRGDIAFAAQPLNYWRDHSGTARTRAMRGGKFIFEALDVIDFISHEVTVPKELRKAAYKFNVMVALGQDCPTRLGVLWTLKLAIRTVQCDPRLVLCFVEYYVRRLVPFYDKMRYFVAWNCQRVYFGTKRRVLHVLSTKRHKKDH
jgi:glycosyltransferase involved in cell wall biosynthesis